ncbi:hypothetical protein MRX96_001049 [Rhipicephalus microplus]
MQGPGERLGEHATRRAASSPATAAGGRSSRGGRETAAPNIHRRGSAVRVRATRRHRAASCDASGRALLLLLLVETPLDVAGPPPLAAEESRPRRRRRRSRRPSRVRSHRRGIAKPSKSHALRVQTRSVRIRSTLMEPGLRGLRIVPPPAGREDLTSLL